MYVNDMTRVATRQCGAVSRSYDLLIASPTTTLPNHTISFAIAFVCVEQF